ncbi:MAG: hypothetical protein ACFB51_18025 [Anaerolineae bacterium]
MTTYHVDRLHGGVRLAILGAFFVGFYIGAWLVIPNLLPALGLEAATNLMPGLLGGIIFAMVFSWLAEQILPRVWPSRRRLVVTGDAIKLQEGDELQAILDRSERLTIFSWSFPIETRRAAVPRGWYCLAVRVAQGRRFISPYTFMPPDALEDFPQIRSFTELISEKEAKKPGNEHLLDIFGEQGHLRAAESDRWRDGVEMSREDFRQLVLQLRDIVPEWKRSE